MNKKVSNKIVYLNFILAFLILNLHSAYMELFDTNNTVLVINQFVRIVCNMAVPTFFFVSAIGSALLVIVQSMLLQKQSG